MNILFLDDSHSRHDFMCKKEHVFHRFQRCTHGAYEIFHAYKVIDIIAFLEEDIYFDFVYLDHDLGSVEERTNNKSNYIYVPKEDSENTGIVAATYLANDFNDYKNKIGKIIIHSWNAPGAKNMEAILRDGGYTDILISPFSCA